MRRHGEMMQGEMAAASTQVEPAVCCRSASHAVGPHTCVCLAHASHRQPRVLEPRRCHAILSNELHHCKDRQVCRVRIRIRVSGRLLRRQGFYSGRASRLGSRGGSLGNVADRRAGWQPQAEHAPPLLPTTPHPRTHSPSTCMRSCSGLGQRMPAACRRARFLISFSAHIFTILRGLDLQ